VADGPELVRLRALMLQHLGVDPGPADAPWRRAAQQWFEQHLTDDHGWACFVVGGNPGETLLASGISWITHHLPGPRWPDGRRGYIAGMITDTSARRRGYARDILRHLIAWFAELGIDYIELHASPDGEPLYHAAGFVPASQPAMELILTNPHQDNGAQDER
jgi:ribosomal protein S18 acetylase RimI-like enzyme